MSAERNSPWWIAVVSRPSATLRSSGRAAIAPKTCIPLQSPSRFSAQTGSSCRQSTSGRSSVARRIICSRNPCRSGGLALPWKTFQVRTSRLTGRASLGLVLRRSRFAEVIARQLDLFVRDNLELLEACDAAELAYDRAERDGAEERFGDYQELVEDGTEILAGLRDNFASTLDEETAEEYEEAFNRAVEKRLPRFGLEIEDT